MEEDFNVLKILECYQAEMARCNANLQRLWSRKFASIATLNDLEELTIDFTDAFSPDGCFVGFESAQDWPTFWHGLPRVLKIIASNRDLEAELYNIFFTTNAELSLCRHGKISNIMWALEKGYDNFRMISRAYQRLRDNWGISEFREKSSPVRCFFSIS